MGKSTIAQQIAADYKLHHIHIKDVIAQAIDNLNKAAKKAENDADRPGGGGERGMNGEDGGEEDEEEEEIDEDEELPDLEELETINENMESNNGNFDEK